MTHAAVLTRALRMALPLLASLACALAGLSAFAAEGGVVHVPALGLATASGATKRTEGGGGRAGGDLGVLAAERADLAIPAAVGPAAIREGDDRRAALVVGCVDEPAHLAQARAEVAAARGKAGAVAGRDGLRVGQQDDRQAVELRIGLSGLGRPCPVRQDCFSPRLPSCFRLGPLRVGCFVLHAHNIALPLALVKGESEGQCRFLVSRSTVWH